MRLDLFLFGAFKNLLINDNNVHVATMRCVKKPSLLPKMSAEIAMSAVIATNPHPTKTTSSPVILSQLLNLKLQTPITVLRSLNFALFSQLFVYAGAVFSFRWLVVTVGNASKLSIL